MKSRSERIATFLMSTLILLLSAILGLYIWAIATGRANEHSNIAEAIETQGRQLDFIICLLTIPEERDAQAVADCASR